MQNIDLIEIAAWLREGENVPELFRASSPLMCPVAIFVCKRLLLQVGAVRSHPHITLVDGPSGCSCAACGGLTIPHNPQIEAFIHNLDLRHHDGYVRKSSVLELAAEVLDWSNRGMPEDRELSFPPRSRPLLRLERLWLPFLAPVVTTEL